METQLSFKRRKTNMTDTKHIFGHILRSMICGFFRSIIISVLFLFIHNLSRFLRTHQIVNEFSYLICTSPSSCLVDTLHSSPQGIDSSLISLLGVWCSHFIYLSYRQTRFELIITKIQNICGMRSSKYKIYPLHST